MEHRGKTIRKTIDSYGIKHSFIYNKLGIAKDTFMRWLKTPNLPDETVERIGNIIRHDFTVDFSGMKKTVFENEKPVATVAEPIIQLPEKSIKKLLSDIDEIKTKLSKLS